MTGCGHNLTVGSVKTYPSNGLVKCKTTGEIPKLKDKEYGTVISKLVEVMDENDDCAIRHNDLVDFIDKQEK